MPNKYDSFSLNADINGGSLYTNFLHGYHSWLVFHFSLEADTGCCPINGNANGSVSGRL